MIYALKRHGKIKVSFLISIIVSTATGLFALLILSIFQGYIDFLGIFLSISIPMTVIPIIVLKFSTLLLRLEDSKSKLEEKNIELLKAQKEVKILNGLLPICANCKKIRDDKGYWNNLESFIQNHSEASFSHGICSDCSDELYGDEDWYKKMKKDQKEK